MGGGADSEGGVMVAAITMREGIDAAPRARLASDEPIESAQERLERGVLATLAAHPAASVAEGLARLFSDDLTFPKHVALLRGIQALHERGELVTAAALAVELEALNVAAAYRSTTFLERALSSPEPLDALNDHIARLKDSSGRRRVAHELHAVGATVAQGAPTADVVEALAGAAAAALDASRWPDPVPLGVPAPPLWPREVLRGPLGKMSHVIADAYQVPLDMPAVLGLGVIAAAVGGRVQVRARRAWREPLSVFTAVAMAPASRKSAAVRAMSYPLVEWERREADRVGGEIDESLSTLRVAEKALTRAEEAVGRAKDEEAREKAESRRRQCVADLAAARLNQVKPPRIVTDDATPEALTSLLAEHGGRFAVISAEGGGLFDMMAGKYSSSVNLDVYLKGHAGDTIRVDRKGRAPEYIRDPALTVAVATQPDTFRVLASRPELRGRGLPARFLYSVPLSNIGFRDIDPPPPDPEPIRAWGELVRTLLMITADVDDEGRARTRQLTLSEEASYCLDVFAGAIEARLRPGQDLAEVADWGGKLVGAAVRLAGLMHLAEHDWTGPVVPWEVPIDGGTMDRAAWLADNYFIPHARVAFQAMGDTPGVDGARKLLAWIGKRGRASFSSREALRALNRNGDRRTVVDPAIDVLVAHGWIREADRDEKKLGRPSERYLVHPAALRS